MDVSYNSMRCSREDKADEFNDDPHDKTNAPPNENDTLANENDTDNNVDENDTRFNDDKIVEIAIKKAMKEDVSNLAKRSGSDTSGGSGGGSGGGGGGGVGGGRGGGGDRIGSDKGSTMSSPPIDDTSIMRGIKILR